MSLRAVATKLYVEHMPERLHFDCDAMRLLERRSENGGAKLVQRNSASDLADAAVPLLRARLREK